MTDAEVETLVKVLVNALEFHEKQQVSVWGSTIAEAHAASCASCWALRAWRAKVPIEFKPVDRVPEEVLKRWERACPGCGSARVWFYNGTWSFDRERSEERGPEIKWCPFCGTQLKTRGD